MRNLSPGCVLLLLSSLLLPPPSPFLDKGWRGFIAAAALCQQRPRRLVLARSSVRREKAIPNSTLMRVSRLTLITAERLIQAKTARINTTAVGPLSN